MPRYYVDTFDRSAVRDEVGVELPDDAAMRREVHRTLAAMMLDEKPGEPSIGLSAHVRDETGRRVMTATLHMAVTVA